MGSGCSRPDSPRIRRSGLQKRRRGTLKRTVSNLLVCGASSSRSPDEMEDDPAELPKNCAEHGQMEKLKFAQNDSGLSKSCGADLISIKHENGISPGRYVAAGEIVSLGVGSSHVQPGVKGKCLSEDRQLVPSHQFIANFRGNETTTASTSYLDQPSPDCFPENETVRMGVVNQRSNVIEDQSQVGKRINKPHSLPSRCSEESLFDEVSVENNVSETNGYSNVDSDCSEVSDSLVDFHSLSDDTSQESITPGSEFLLSDTEQDRPAGRLLQIDVVGIPSDILSSNSSETSYDEVRRHSRRLFWDVFSRRNSRRLVDSRTFVISPGDSDDLRSLDRWRPALGVDFSSDETGGDSRSQGSRTEGSNELRPSSRLEIWERFHGSLDSTNRQIAACPRGIHLNGSCLCQSRISDEESGARSGISRIVMLAEALFEVLDQMHQQPFSLSLSTVSVPAPESVVDSFPLKTHTKAEGLGHADDISQCYICLSEYEEGDSIRILPCHHEYHKICVDKWLKEFHGVCPLCRGDVCQGSAQGSI